MEVSQVLLVREDDGLVLSDNLAPEALPARGQIPQLLQFTHSARKTHTHTHTSGVEPAHFPGRGTGVPTKQENKADMEVQSMPGKASDNSYTAGLQSKPGGRGAHDTTP